MTDYVLDNAHTAAATRLRILELLYDPITRASLDAAGIGPGQDVWEVGCGAGSIARWAAVDRGARVTATDIDLRHLPARIRAGCTVLHHDVTVEDPPGTFDLIHVRLVLSHLRSWPQVLGRLATSLRSGGWLCVEELDPMLPYLPSAGPGHLINRVGRAFTEVLASRGGDPTLGRSLHWLLGVHGLARISATGTILGGHGGGAIAQLMTVNVQQTRDLLLDAGLAPDELDTYEAALRDSTQWLTMPVLWAARGQVPA